MKPGFTLLISILISTIQGFSQEKIFYNLYWEETIPDSAHFFSYIKEDTIQNGSMIYYYLDGGVFEEKTYVEGVPTGKYYQYYKDKRKAMVGVFENGILKRVAAWDKDGVKLMRRGNGKDVSYYPNGYIREIINVKNGYPLGSKMRFYSNGQTAEMGNSLANGFYKVISSWNYYGEPMVIEGNGGYAMIYYNGNLMSKGEYQSGFESGEWTRYYSNGKKRSVENFNNGILDGRAKYYHSNGMLSSVGSYIMGKRTGIWNRYDENGKLINTSTY